MNYRFVSLFLFTIAIAHVSYATAIITIRPSSANPIAISPSGRTYLTYSITNNNSIAVSNITIDPGYETNLAKIKLSVAQSTCAGITLTPGASCTFSLIMQGLGGEGVITLQPKVCLYNGVVCSIPILNQRSKVTLTSALPNTSFPTPYAGTFYPIYNSGYGQWVPPSQTPIPPFNQVSAIFVSFAHAYPQGTGAVFAFEAGQPDEPARLAQLTAAARSANPSIKIIMSLGWGKNDWTYINNDYINYANIFVPSVIQFIRTYHLDGIDIDDESIGEEGMTSSGFISQANFDGVIANLRNALNEASLIDHMPYYLTITPAGNNQSGGIENTQVDAQNALSFNLINIQSYYNGSETFGEDFYEGLLVIGYPAQQIANGIDTQESCTPDYPPYIGLAGMFNWNMTADALCSTYTNTAEIAALVGYPATS